MSQGDDPRSGESRSHRARPSVVVIGTLDTKGEELDFIRARLVKAGMTPILVDVGILGASFVEPDVDRCEVAAEGGFDLDAVTAEQGRGPAVAAMADAAAATVRRLYAEGRCDGIIGAGGGTNTAIATAAMRALPIGVPKLMVSTLAGTEASAFVDAGDVIQVPSVVDVAGLNGILSPILANAAAAIAAMVAAPRLEPGEDRTQIAATMFGVTTPCTTVAREALEEQGYEVITFHATGSGGVAMERLLEDGFFAGVLDATTTEIADELVGGALSAGAGRLSAAGATALPQVVSLGALDIVNFGAPDSVPSDFSARLFSAHNAQSTLMRTSSEECRQIGAELGRRLSAARGPTAVFVPLRGTSALSGPGGVFHDPAADEALFASLRENLAEQVELYEMDSHINDPEFARAMVARLMDFLGKEQE